MMLNYNCSAQLNLKSILFSGREVMRGGVWLSEYKQQSVASFSSETVVLNKQLKIVT